MFVVLITHDVGGQKPYAATVISKNNRKIYVRGSRIFTRGTVNVGDTVFQFKYNRIGIVTGYLGHKVCVRFDDTKGVLEPHNVMPELITTTK